MAEAAASGGSLPLLLEGSQLSALDDCGGVINNLCSGNGSHLLVTVAGKRVQLVDAIERVRCVLRGGLHRRPGAEHAF